MLPPGSLRLLEKSLIARVTPARRRVIMTAGRLTRPRRWGRVRRVDLPRRLGLRRQRERQEAEHRRRSHGWLAEAPPRALDSQL